MSLTPSATRPAQQGANARNKFIELERLAQIVIGALIENRHQILQAVDRREHLAAALLAEPDETVIVRQAEIQEQRIVMGGGERAVGVGCRGHMIDGEVAILQRRCQTIGEPPIVLNEQEAHLPPLFQLLMEEPSVTLN
jgi:hypothetical protein